VDFSVDPVRIYELDKLQDIFYFEGMERFDAEFLLVEMISQLLRSHDQDDLDLYERHEFGVFQCILRKSWGSSESWPRSRST